ncbi:pantetheine-phosphate adenylyltransferase [Mycoplasmopsis gallinarum]|uniref:pantetheine-phosphate adenylyltransferase n=1 Tax=Mycoplasmopsis gallinarum TaxID=29557 RepID=UPI00047F4AA3|nr:pantetheine-phosphate adenylyltransferase [Mycoplasmopsis gallinarum]
MEKVAIYPGSFDPLHKGHISVIQKALKLFDKLIVVVSINPDKDNLINIEERYQTIKNQLASFKNVEVLLNRNQLIGELSKDLNVQFLVRSARNQIDYDYELDLASGHHTINPDLETILIIPDYEMLGVSSTLERHLKSLKK